MPSLEAILAFVQGVYAQYGYPIVLVASLLENTMLTGFFFPGGTMVLLAGVYARSGVLWLPAVILCGALGTILGTSLDFAIGVATRKGLLRRWTDRPRFRTAAGWARDWFGRYGPRAMIVAHFVGAVRSLAAVGAGLSGFPYRRFVLYEAPAALLWNTVHTLVGFLIAESLQQAEVGGWIVPLIGVAAVALMALFQLLTRAIRRVAGVAGPDR